MIARIMQYKIRKTQQNQRLCSAQRFGYQNIGILTSAFRFGSFPEAQTYCTSKRICTVRMPQNHRKMQYGNFPK